jgi:hypothetical protein
VIELIPVEIVAVFEPRPKLQPLRVKPGKIEPTTPVKVPLGKNEPNDKGAEDETEEEMTLELATELDAINDEIVELDESTEDEITELDRAEDETCAELDEASEEEQLITVKI